MKVPPQASESRPDTSPTRMARPVAVVVVADDPITTEGVVTYLSAVPATTVVARERAAEADVALFVAGRVTGRTVAAMKAVSRSAGGGELPIVLVADGISGTLLVRAISHGLVSYLVRGQVDLDRTVDALVAGSHGRTELPPHMVEELVTQVRELQRGGFDGIEAGLGELTRRETEVLSLIAEGLTTAEIATRLNYAERTIKSVLHTVIVRLKLKNRAHAVAYAMRTGAI